MSIFGWATGDANRKVYNNLIRIKTPNDDYPSDQKCAALTASCLCTPVTAFEGLGLILCGLATCPTQLIGCRGKLTTNHRNKTVEFESCKPDYGCPIPPFGYKDFYYKDNYNTTGTFTEKTGCFCKLPCGTNAYNGNLEETRVVSSLTPTDCLWGGAMSVSEALCQVVQCPFAPLCFSCHK